MSVVRRKRERNKIKSSVCVEGIKGKIK